MPEKNRWTVVGYFPDLHQIWHEHVMAEDAEEAQKRGVLKIMGRNEGYIGADCVAVVGVFPGLVENHIDSDGVKLGSDILGEEG